MTSVIFVLLRSAFGYFFHIRLSVTRRSLLPVVLLTVTCLAIDRTVTSRLVALVAYLRVAVEALLSLSAPLVSRRLRYFVAHI